jgi:hypothetical protein
MLPFVTAITFIEIEMMMASAIADLAWMTFFQRHMLITTVTSAQGEVLAEITELQKAEGKFPKVETRQ